MQYEFSIRKTFVSEFTEAETPVQRGDGGPLLDL